MEQFETIEGSVENIIYKNPENAYSVFCLLHGDEETICVGNIIDLNQGESMRISGVFVMHPFYGKQLSVKSFERVIPKTEQGIERYLGSGVIKGIGASRAKSIVQRFGEDTFDIIENEPIRLAEIRGISETLALSIADSYIRQIEMKNTMLYLQDLGLTTTMAIKIYMQYRESTIDTIKTNPYKVADDIFGIGFKTADALAMKLGIEKNSVYRVKSGLKFVLNSWAANGHTFTPRERLYAECAELLEAEGLPIAEALTDLQLESHVVQKLVGGEEAVYLSYYYHAEINCAKKIALLSREEKQEKDNSDEIAAFERDNDITLAGKQKEAVAESLKRGVLVITGGPGTGKTTIINALITILGKKGKKIILTAPTGRAAKRMTEATGTDAQTIHRLLGSGYVSDSPLRKFEKNEENPLECDAVIVDETSMVDIMLLNSLLRAVPQGTRLILVGDANQLPSVGAGNVLSDIIGSGCVAVVKLEEVFRQAQKSAIVMNAHRINRGEGPIFNEKDTDFFFVGRDTVQGTIDAVLELVSKRLPAYLKTGESADIQVLTPMRKSTLGVTEINKLLQERLNPPSPKKREKERGTGVFREGDKVMQIKNNYDVSWFIRDKSGWITDEGAGIYNGDQGTITYIDNENSTVTVQFDDGKTVDYEWSRLEELELSYATTIHKSQGSEYPAVVIPVLTGPYMLMTRNLLYTAVTRARSLVVLVGSREKILEMVGNNIEVKRYSALKEQLIKAFSLLL